MLDTVPTGFNMFCLVNQTWFLNQKKEHHVKGTTRAVILNTHHTYIGLRARGWGGTLLLRGTCHMLSESGLKQKAIKCKQDSQAARPSQERGRGGRGSGEVDVCVPAGVCLCGFSAKRGDSRCGNLGTNLWTCFVMVSFRFTLKPNPSE